MFKTIADAFSCQYEGHVTFDHLDLWLDPAPRPGPEAMAVDEWLLETATTPVLRVYQWSGNWATVGCFGVIAEARRAVTGVDWVRRWTGGGTVDHRNDWTYTVVAPAGTRVHGLRGAESYRLLHAALAEALAFEGIHARLSSGAGETGAAMCFKNPVSHDLIDSSAGKLAGAGQRRTKHGLLHQGSVSGTCDGTRSDERGRNLAGALSKEWRHGDYHPPDVEIAARVEARYGSVEWTERR